MADPFIGEIRLFGFNFNPRGWAFCAGALLPISQNSTLFSLVGTFYGGDGRTTFALPELRGKSPMSKGRHPGSLFDWRIGQRAGSETHTLTIPELANHTHNAVFTASGGGSTDSASLTATTEDGDSATPSNGAFLATAKPQSSTGPDKPEKIYKSSPTAGTEVNLGGVKVAGGDGATGGIVSVNTAGKSNKFSIIQPVLTLNYCIALIGIYPPRS